MATSLTTRRQNARRLMVLQDITTREAAEQIGVPTSHLYAVLAGRTHPSQVVRDKLPALLGASIEQCFDEALLSKEYGGRRGPRAKAIRNDA